jgi:hypothetical protein
MNNGIHYNISIKRIWVKTQWSQFIDNKQIHLAFPAQLCTNRKASMKDASAFKISYIPRQFR